MTVEQLTAKVYEKLKDKDFGSEMGRLLAIQVNLTGRIGGVFYIEILTVGCLSCRMNIDRDAVLSMTLTNCGKLLSGKLDMQEAYHAGKVKIEGDRIRLCFYPVCDAVKKTPFYCAQKAEFFRVVNRILESAPQRFAFA